MLDHIGKVWIEFLEMSFASMGFYVAFALIFLVLCKGNKCNEEVNYWKKENLFVDLGYWFIIPVVTKYLKIFLLLIGAQYLLGLETEAEQMDYFENGFGVIGDLPIWLQIIFLLVVSDIYLYFMHRLFHRNALWKFHAIHHSTKDLDWASAQRFHPVNTWLSFMAIDIAMLLMGVAPEAFVVIAPYNAFFSAFVHANLNWKLGPLQYVIATPVFHRWHHTAADRGGSKNFAPTFPVLDIIFGTFYMPKDKLPDNYGVDDKNFPQNNFVDQLLYPFKKNRSKTID